MRPLILLMLLLSTSSAIAKRPAPGEEPPELGLMATTGKKISLADYKGKRAVVIAFFPKAFTGG